MNALEVVGIVIAVLIGGAAVIAVIGAILAMLASAMSR